MIAQNIHARFVFEEALLFKRVHLLLPRGEKQIAVIPFLDLCLELAGTVRVERDLHVRVAFHIVLRDFLHGRAQTGRDENLQFYGLLL